MLTVRWGRPVLGAIAATLALANAGSASAAEIRVAKIATGTAILVSGDLAYGDGERFAKLVAGTPRATVLFDSPGGNLLAGLAIGEAIRAHGYTTLVADGSLCASACAIAWLGGTKRLLSPGARLGFHAASSEDGVSAGGNAMVGAYMARLGLSSKAVFALTSASPYDMAWLDLPAAKTLGIAVDYYSGPASPAPQTLASRRPGSSPAMMRSLPGSSRQSSVGTRAMPEPQPYRSNGMADHSGRGGGDDRECTVDESHSGGC